MGAAAHRPLDPLDPVDPRDRAATAVPLDVEEMRAWRSFVYVATRALDLLDHELQAAHGLSLPDYEILVALSEEPERQMQMTELAQVARLSQSRLTYRIDRLGTQGLVERVPCDDDGRRIWARLTRAGLQKLEAAYPTHLEGVRRYVVDPADRADLPRLTLAFEQMKRAIDGDPA